MSGTVRPMERSIAELVGETDVEALTAEQVVETVLETLHPEVALACSFQKEESVLVDMILERQPKARIFALDTHVLFPETYTVWRAIEQRYGIRIEVFEGPSLGRQAAIHGDALWERNPDLCCSIRKIGPLGSRALGAPGMDHRRPARPGPEPRDDAEARLGRAPRDLEGEPARRLVGRRRLGVRP